MTASINGFPGYIAGTWTSIPSTPASVSRARHMMASKVRAHIEKFAGQIVTAAGPLQSSAATPVE
jgi:polyisoprenoid-binding protein YceI